LKIDFNKFKYIYIFLPHQDDEIGIIPLLDLFSIKKNNIKVVFCTKNESSKKNLLRNLESLKILKKFNIVSNNVLFIGDKLNILDGKLINNTQKLFEYLKNLIPKNQNKITLFLTTAYEGGHPDHDSLNLIIKFLAKNFNHDNFFSFPLYNSGTRLPFPYNAFTPHKTKKGNFIKIKKWNLKYLFLPLAYKTQIKTIIGLYPFYLYRILFNRGFYITRELINNTVIRKPHQGNLLYEKRKWLKYEEFESKVKILYQI